MKDERTLYGAVDKSELENISVVAFYRIGHGKKLSSTPNISGSYGRQAGRQTKYRWI